MEQALEKKESVFGATLLVSGCCIGAAMIGLPVVSAFAGLIPSTLAMVICYFFATTTGLLILEATLWFDRQVNLITLAQFALGRAGKVVTWVLFLFLFYCLFVAYIDGGGQLFSGLLTSLLNVPVSREVGMVVCVSFVGMTVYAGTRFVSGINRLFMLGMALSYCTLVVLGLSHVTGSRLLETNWVASIGAIPIFLVSFGFQNLVPTLTYYAKRNVSTLRFAIYVGNLIPFVVYFIWNSVILGMLPEMGSPEFEKVLSQTDMVGGLLTGIAQPEVILMAVTTFSFFALLTPFIVNTLAFVDFLKDGFKMSSDSKYEILIYALVLLPPTIFTFIYPHLFLKALGLVGGFADVLLLGVIPVLIVWKGRYVEKIKGPFTVPGGKLLLCFIFLLSVACLFIKK